MTFSNEILSWIGVEKLPDIITFDLDGVLIQNPFRLGVFPHVCRELAPLVVEVTPELARRKVLNKIIAEAKRRLLAGLFVEAYDWDDIVAAVAMELAEKAGTGEQGGARGSIPPRFDVAALVRHYCRVPGMIWLLPEARETLVQLRAEGRRLGVVTNGYRKYQLPVLEALGIADFFDVIVTPEEVPAVKPQRELFQAAWRGCDTPLHIGDDLIHDGWGARAAGGYSVWLHRELPAALLGHIPEERPEQAGFADVRDRAFAKVMAVQAFGVEPAACVPNAVIGGLGEVRALITRLERGR